MAESNRDEIAKLESMYAANPEGRVFTHLAEAYRRAGDLGRAREVLDEGLRRHEDSASGYVVLGRVMQDMGQPEDARGAFRRVLDLDPENRVALRALGELAHAAGRREEALGHLERLFALDPADDTIEALIANIREAPTEIVAPESMQVEPTRAEPAEPSPFPLPFVPGSFQLSSFDLTGADQESGQAAETAAAEAAQPAPESGWSGGLPPEEPPAFQGGGSDTVQGFQPFDAGQAAGFETTAGEPLVSGFDFETERDLAKLPDYEGGQPTELVTETMADLYRSQGHLVQAAEVYRALLRERPGDEQLERKLLEVELAILAPDMAPPGQDAREGAAALDAAEAALQGSGGSEASQPAEPPFAPYAPGAESLATEATGPAEAELQTPPVEELAPAGEPDSAFAPPATAFGEPGSAFSAPETAFGQPAAAFGPPEAEFEQAAPEGLPGSGFGPVSEAETEPQPTDTYMAEAEAAFAQPEGGYEPPSLTGAEAPLPEYAPPEPETPSVESYAAEAETAYASPEAAFEPNEPEREAPPEGYVPAEPEAGYAPEEEAFADAPPTEDAYAPAEGAFAEAPPPDSEAQPEWPQAQPEAEAQPDWQQAPPEAEAQPDWPQAQPETEAQPDWQQAPLGTEPVEAHGPAAEPEAEFATPAPESVYSEPEGAAEGEQAAEPLPLLEEPEPGTAEAGVPAMEAIWGGGAELATGEATPYAWEQAAADVESGPPVAEYLRSLVGWRRTAPPQAAPSPAEPTWADEAAAEPTWGDQASREPTWADEAAAPPAQEPAASWEPPAAGPPAEEAGQTERSAVDAWEQAGAEAKAGAEPGEDMSWLMGPEGVAQEGPSGDDGTDSSESPADDDDLEMFRAWLQSLKK